MVPHIKVEEKLHELAGVTEQCSPSPACPMKRKANVSSCCTRCRSELAAVLEKLAACDLPNLWKPRPDQFFHVDALPFSAPETGSAEDPRTGDPAFYRWLRSRDSCLMARWSRWQVRLASPYRALMSRTSRFQRQEWPAGPERRQRVPRG